MKQFDEEPEDSGLADVSRRLRENKIDASPLELDRIKVQAMRQAQRPGGRPMRSRLAALTTAALLMLGGGATFAIAENAKGGKSETSAADKQYTGKKCGNPNKPQSAPPGNPSNDDCPPQSQK